MGDEPSFKATIETLSARSEELRRQRDKISAQISEVESEISVLKQAIKLVSRYSGQLSIGLEGLSPPPPMQPYPSPHPPVREAVIGALSSLGEGKISDIVRIAEGDRPGSINPKTAGNALWVLKNEGQAERVGMIWRWLGPKENPRSDEPTGG